jgi:hypothetical protein
MEKTKLRLAIRLQEISHELAERAEAGEFSDYESQHATPKMVLVNCLRAISKTTTNLTRKLKADYLTQEVISGKFDETREEAEEWYQREGKDLLKPRNSGVS